MEEVEVEDGRRWVLVVEVLGPVAAAVALGTRFPLTEERKM